MSKQIKAYHIKQIQHESMSSIFIMVKNYLLRYVHNRAPKCTKI